MMPTDWMVYAIGFLAQIMFSGRTFYQWIASERSKRVIAPRFFWQISMFASFLLFVYGYFRHDFAIILGQTLTYFIYIRNLQMIGAWKKFPVISRYFFIALPLFVTLYSITNNRNDIDNLLINHNIPLWLFTLGIVSQVLFTFRFIYQWLHSEVRKKSSLPLGFWIISLSGSLLILLYAIFRKDPVLLAGHLFGSVVYIRNMILLIRNAKKN
jgi:lipid-A-disaccharide synthase-like uncharacterized protein